MRKPYGTRLYQIVKCLDNMEEYQGWHKKDPSTPLVFMIGQMDQLEELHRLLYEVEPDEDDISFDFGWNVK